MSKLRMSYIFIEKEKNENIIIKDLVMNIIDSIVYTRTGESVTFEIESKEKINYYVNQKDNDGNCYVEFTSNHCNKETLKSLEILDKAFLSSSQQKYFECVKNYDGVSENYCKRLYSKCSNFERNFRCMLLLILTKAYGHNWHMATVPKDIKKNIKEREHGNINPNKILEYMDLFTLTAYLFDERTVDYPNVVGDNLSAEKKRKLSKEDSIQIIENLKPISLWDKCFEKYGSASIWKGCIKEISDIRNKVAHHKTVSKQEFETSNDKLNKINKKLTYIIAQMQTENFSKEKVIDITENFNLKVVTTALTELTKNMGGIFGTEYLQNRGNYEGISTALTEFTKRMGGALGIKYLQNRGNYEGISTALTEFTKRMEGALGAEYWKNIENFGGISVLNELTKLHDQKIDDTE